MTYGWGALTPLGEAVRAATVNLREFVERLEAAKRTADTCAPRWEEFDAGREPSPRGAVDPDGEPGR